MIAGFPEKVVDLAEVHADDHVFYVPNPDGAEGFVLSSEARRDLAAMEADYTAKKAEQHARIARADAQLARMIITGAAREALVDAGADPGLLGGAVALFIEQMPLVAAADEQVTTADGCASVAFAAAGWLDTNPAWRDRRRTTVDGPGEFTRRLRAVLLQ